MLGKRENCFNAYFLVCLFVFCGAGELGLRALCMLEKHSATELHHVNLNGLCSK